MRVPQYLFKTDSGRPLIGHGIGEQPRRDLEPQASHPLVETPGALEVEHVFPISVLTVPCDPAVYPPDARDYYLMCGCGWWSLPHWRMFEPREIRCEVCVAKLAGRDNFQLFATGAVKRGCFVVGQVELPEGG